MIISKKSGLTGKMNFMDLPVTQEQLDRFQNGELIQHVLPDLTAAEREFLITGSTPEEWDELFDGEE